jgi:hypothetical protein
VLVLLVVFGPVAVGTESVVSAVGAEARLSGTVVSRGATVGSETTEVDSADAAAGKVAGEAGGVAVGKGTGRM